MRLTIARKLALAGGILVALVVGVGLLAYRSASTLSGLARALATQRLDERAVALELQEQAQRTTTLLGLGAIAMGLMLPIALATIAREVARRRQAEMALEQRDARFRAAVEGSHDAFYVLRVVSDTQGDPLDFEFVEVNREAERWLGLTRDAIIGQRLCELMPANRTNGFFDLYVRAMRSADADEGEREIADPSMRARWVRYQVVPLDDGVAVTSRDVTDRKHHEETLRALSLMDELTGLYNRRGFLTLAEQQLRQARRTQRELVLLFVDMDDFKEINDRHGHKQGDVALQRTAAILRRTFRDSDIVARLGGDEFVVLATDVSLGTGPLIVDRLRVELAQANAIEGYPYRMSFSVGLAVFDPDRPPDIDELLATADAMLYEQKKHKHEGWESSIGARHPVGAA
jgi:diguanylate cyclase (GGDEF)-like protein/PAS domain S-box-containing protein